MCRLIPVLVAAVLSVATTTVFAQSDSQPTPLIMQDLAGSTANADGSHTLTFALTDGKRFSVQVPAEQSFKVISALSAPTTSGSQQKLTGAIVQRMAIAVAPNGSALILLPVSAAGPLEPLAFPISGVENFIQVLQQKLGEARAKAASQPNAK